MLLNNGLPSHAKEKQAVPAICLFQEIFGKNQSADSWDLCSRNLRDVWHYFTMTNCRKEAAQATLSPRVDMFLNLL